MFEVKRGVEKGGGGEGDAVGGVCFYLMILFSCFFLFVFNICV